MVRLKWDNEDSPMYQTGVSQGVFYGDDGVGHAWSGLVSVTEKPQNNAPTAVYNAMGEKYDNFGNVAEKKHGLACYVYPEVMDEYLGYEYLGNFGFVADERPPKKFHMAYRVELGDGLYEIHVLLNQIATFGETARLTLADSIAPSTITMNLEGAVDPRLGTSHIRLDSRLPITKSAEMLLFGDQYTEPNIHDFLAAEPVWETVAVNYAPIIEPDYDNMVWLGRENLLLESRAGWSNASYYLTGDGVQLRDSNIQAGETITISLKGTLGSDREIFSIFNSGGYLNLTTLSPSDKGPDGVFRKTFNWRDTHPTADIPNTDIRVYNVPNSGTTVSSIEWIKIERGSTVTPWTPAPSDPDQKPIASDPRPDNYKPGVKKSDVWTGKDKLTVFYDEENHGLGIYSKTQLTDVDNYEDLYTDDYTPYIGVPVLPKQELSGSKITISSTVNIPNPIYPLVSNRYAALGLGPLGPKTDSPPNTRGSKEILTSTPSFKTSGVGYDSILVYHGGLIDSGIVSFSRMSIRTSDDTSYFDINTIPNSRGDRYQRVETPRGDYTIHQQLRLRTTSKVELSYITQYDFWLEASDSMLLRQNETFTFNGPQAVIDGDTFTVDDSIQGYAEG